MKTATVTEFRNNPSSIMKTAKNETVTITQRGKPVLVIHRATAAAALERAKNAVKQSDSNIDSFGVLDW